MSPAPLRKPASTEPVRVTIASLSDIETRSERPGPTLAEHYDVVIVGASLAGCAVAEALAQADGERRRRILIVDRHPDVHPRFSGEFIHPGGAQILDDLGFYESLSAAGGVDVDGFAVFENADARHVDLPYAGIKGHRPRGLSIHHKVLIRTMRQRLREHRAGHVELVEGWSVNDLVRGPRGEIAGVVLETAGHKAVTVRADLVVGADGKSSSVRKLAGISDEGRETIGFTAGIEVHNATLPRGSYAHVFLGGWGPILAYPILRHDGGVSTRITFDLPLLLPAKGERMKAYVMRTYLPFIPAPLCTEVAAAIRALEGPLEIAPTVNLPAPTAAMPGLVLVGDAAGCSHPITASGMTMGLRDAATLGKQAVRRHRVPEGEPWLDGAALRGYRAEHDRYVPTRQALADAIYEAFRGGGMGARSIRRALFEYWGTGVSARTRSMALLSGAERRPHVFLTEYLKTAGHALSTSFSPQHARHFPIGDRVRRATCAAQLARGKLGLVAAVMWAQIRPAWMVRDR
ncbi:MAG: FAD-dependent monooxygenase [Nannocystaceae bacterium]|nr:FAD-dependent monooxygenase [Nannocystaceae bacterium]